MYGMSWMFLKEARQKALVLYQWVTGFLVSQDHLIRFSYQHGNTGWSGGVLSAENDFYDVVEAVSRHNSLPRYRLMGLSISTNLCEFMSTRMILSAHISCSYW